MRLLFPYMRVVPVLEAVQFRDIWHAVVADAKGQPMDMTFCGLTASQAKSRRQWIDLVHELRCLHCEPAASRYAWAPWS
jgi:L-rhamnose isomerase